MALRLPVEPEFKQNTLQKGHGLDVSDLDVVSALVLVLLVGLNPIVAPDDVGAVVGGTLVVFLGNHGVEAVVGVVLPSCEELFCLLECLLLGEPLENCHSPAEACAEWWKRNR